MRRASTIVSLMLACCVNIAAHTARADEKPAEPHDEKAAHEAGSAKKPDPEVSPETKAPAPKPLPTFRGPPDHKDELRSSTTPVEASKQHEGTDHATESKPEHATPPHEVDAEEHAISETSENKPHSPESAHPAHPDNKSALNSGSSALKAEVDRHTEKEQLKAESKSLIPHGQVKNQENELERYRRLLDLARDLRNQKDLEAADQHLWELVEPPAPPEIQLAAMLELAGVAVDKGKYSKAQTIYSEIARKFPKDPMLPQVLLIQGRLYRDMGMPEMAVTKFFSVTSVSLNLNMDRLDYYRSLVLRAQSEIADTYYLQGKYAESIGYFKKLLTLDGIDAERPQFMFKLLKSYVGSGNSVDTIATGQLFVNAFTNSVEVPEVRYMISQACRKLNRKDEAMRQVFILLESQEANNSKYPTDWAYWQQRTGNEIANQLYSEGDYISALVVYTKLATLNETLEWQMPVWYQIGLVYEHLKQPVKASETYVRILSRSEEVKTNSPSPSLTALVDMARWRKDFLGWQTNVDNNTRKLAAPMNSALEAQPPTQALTPN